MTKRNTQQQTQINTNTHNKSLEWKHLGQHNYSTTASQQPPPRSPPQSPAQSQHALAMNSEQRGNAEGMSVSMMMKE